MSINGLEHSINQKVMSFSVDISKDQTHEEINEDFANALDVLRCLLKEKNHNIINELLSIHYRKSRIIAIAYERGLKDGITLVDMQHNTAKEKRHKENTSPIGLTTK